MGFMTHQEIIVQSWQKIIFFLHFFFSSASRPRSDPKKFSKNIFIKKHLSHFILKCKMDIIISL
jgi:hypothetical protein